MCGFWKWAAVAAASVAVFAIVAVAYVYLASQQIIGRTYPLPPSHIHASTAPKVIALGQHLVRPYGCADCHRPNLQGTYIADFGMSSRNLTRLATTFSDADFDRAIRKGLRRDGTSTAETMPSDAFQYMPDSDATAIVSYIRSLKPAGADIPEPSYGLKDRWGFLRGMRKTTRDWFRLQKPALELGPRYARARIMAMTACGECHGTSLEGQGGPPHTPPNLSIVASYNRAAFLKFMRSGKAAGNRELPMMSAVARVRISRLTDAELNALYDYLSARGRKLTGSGS
ncbi:MAG: c-type cytochrome [Alphaproteobacteria bacterium]